MIRIKEEAKIENPRNYDSCTVEQLEYLLKAGSTAQRDAQRENFYEIEGESETFYVHISPITGNVVLLAKWLRQSQERYASSGQLVA
jgi:hypothetical protein